MGADGSKTPREPARGGASPFTPALAVLAIACAVVLAIVGVHGWEIAPDGELEGLVPRAFRSPRGEHAVLLQIDPALGTATSEDLLAAAELVRERLGNAVRPIAAPTNEIAAWIDRHALLMMPIESHAELRDRLDDAAIDDAVAALRSRMSSPFFGLTAADERRDPLHLRDLTDAVARERSAIGVLPSGARATVHGDLLSRDGQALLMATRDDTEVAIAALQEPLHERGIAIAIVGPRRTEIELVAGLRAQLGRTAVLWLASTLLVLALVVRRVLPAVLGVAVVAAVLALVARGIGPLGLWSTPLVILLGGSAWLVAPHVWETAKRRTRFPWVPTIVVGTALLPLALANLRGLEIDPVWSWPAIVWLLGTVAVVSLFTFVGFTVQSRRAPARWPGLAHRPWLVAGITVLAGAIGLVGLVRMPVRALFEASPGARFEAPEQAVLVQAFFDPHAIVHLDHHAANPADALAGGLDDVQQMLARVPTLAHAVEGPAPLILPQRVLAQRRQSLAELELSERVRKLELSLEAHGFRAAAFGEFLRSAADPEAMPTAEALLASPLRGWIDRYLDAGPDRARVRTNIHVHDDADLRALLGWDGEPPLPVVGPAVARLVDGVRVRDALIALALAQIWLGALVVWLSRRGFFVAIAAAIAAAVTELMTLACIAGLGLPLSAVLAPAIMIVGASAIVRVDRACDAERPESMRELVLAALGPVAGGLTLCLAHVAPWFELGITTALGSVLAVGIGTTLGPGLVAGFARIDTRLRRRSTSAASHRNPARTDPAQGPSRRIFVTGIGLACMLPRSLRGAEPAAVDKRVQNRVELWANYARHTKTLVVRVTTERESALANEAWITTGTLYLQAPDRLLLRDDAPTGSSTWIDRSRVHVLTHVPNQRSDESLALANDPAARWLAARLLCVFAGSGEALLDDARAVVPPGSGYRLELSPPRGSIVRKAIRSLTLHFDPVAGAVTQILLTEAQGDTLQLRLTDHRQNVDPTEIESAWASVTTARPS